MLGRQHPGAGVHGADPGGAEFPVFYFVHRGRGVLLRGQFSGGAAGGDAGAARAQRLPAAPGVSACRA